MKRLMALLCSLVLVVCMLPTASAYMAETASPSTPWHGQITTQSGSSVNIRSGPGTSYGVVETISNTAYIQIIGKTNNWYHVQYSSNGYTGYIIEDYLNVTGTGYFITIRDTNIMDTSENPIKPVPKDLALPFVNYSPNRFVWTVWGCLEGGIYFTDIDS